MTLVITDKERIKLLVKDLMDVFLPNPDWVERQAVAEFRRRIDALTGEQAREALQKVRKYF